MPAFFFKQPNGLYGRFSTVVDCPTHYNRTKEELIAEYVKKYEEDLTEYFESKNMMTYEEMKSYFVDNNMTKEEWKELQKLMETPIEELNEKRDGRRWHQ